VIEAWSQILYEAIAKAAEAEHEKCTGVTTWELQCPGPRVSEVEEVERKVSDLICQKSRYLMEGRVGNGTWGL